jgi:biopolymer transport protein ExbB
MPRLFFAIFATLALALPLSAQDLELESIADIAEEILDGEGEVTQDGDNEEFVVVTDDDISALEVGDLYKSNSSVFKVESIRSKGSEGGEFTARRVGNTLDPLRSWNRVSGLGPVTIVSRETLLSRFLSGGPLMFPIAFLLLCVIIIFLNSLLVYREKRQCPPGFIDLAQRAIDAGDIGQFEGHALHTKGLLPTICRAMIADFRNASEEQIRIRTLSEAKRRVSGLRMPLRALNFIAAVAPLLGILGTVIGMIACFDSLADQAASAGKAQAMAAGIKVALLTTAAGLCVAVPALFTAFLFNQRLNYIVYGCEGHAEDFVHRLQGLKRKAAPVAESTKDAA